jgi:chaperone modulatory protein CbpM
MMRLEAIITQFPDLDTVELTAWIDRGWVRPDPAPSPADWAFEGVDLARVGLIYDLRRHLGVEEDVVPMVLALVDQVYSLRATLKAVTGAIEHQPAEVRAAVRTAMAETAAPGGGTAPPQ